MRRTFLERQSGEAALVYALFAVVALYAGSIALFVGKVTPWSIAFGVLSVALGLYGVGALVGSMARLGQVLFRVECTGTRVSWSFARGRQELDLNEVRALSLWGQGPAIGFELVGGREVTLPAPSTQPSELFDYLRDHFDGPAKQDGKLLPERRARLKGRYER